jgi:flagellar biosynthesis/type III secretory pathway protein FliH
MSEHLPECSQSLPKVSPMDCICDRLRAAEQRGYDRASAIAYAAAEVTRDVHAAMTQVAVAEAEQRGVKAGKNLTVNWAQAYADGYADGEEQGQRDALAKAVGAIDHEREQLANWSSSESEAALSVWPGDGPTVAEWIAVQTGLRRAVQIIQGQEVKR